MSTVDSVETKPGGESGTDPADPGESTDPAGWRATLWFLGSFVVGAHVTQLLVMGALYAAKRLLP